MPWAVRACNQPSTLAGPQREQDTLCHLCAARFNPEPHGGRSPWGSFGAAFSGARPTTSPSFEVTSENAVAVAAICWRLAGLPLALELAAAKARFLEPTILLLRLDEALSMAWARDLPERQRTMRATLDWSCELLSRPSTDFSVVCQYSPGVSRSRGRRRSALHAAEAGERPEEVLGLLDALVEQSLVVMLSPRPGVEARYGCSSPSGSMPSSA